MQAEQEKTLKVLQVAIQMETDGKEFYLKASRESSNETGRKLLESLAREEDVHKATFKEIYASIKANKGWPNVKLPAPGDGGLRTILSGAAEEAASDLKAQATELDAVKTAMEMENKTYDYYRSQGAVATHKAEKEFYEALAAQERGHYLVLSDYYEYLDNPAAWFVRSEHPTLDGGQ